MSDNMQFKRKFRWTFQATFPAGEIPPCVVKVHARPTLKIKEEQTPQGEWIPGKDYEWEYLTTTWFDADEKELDPLWKVIASFCGEDGQVVEGIDGTAILTLLDGHAVPIEKWILRDIRPWTINFGDLDHSSSGPMTVEITWRYKNAEYENVVASPTSLCPLNKTQIIF